MAKITASGVEPTDLSTYRTIFEQRFRDKFGADLALDAETPQGELIAIMSLAATEMDEALVSSANGNSLTAAVGRQLDDLASLLSIQRNPAIRSTVEVQFGGIPGTYIPEGTLVSNGKAIFATDHNALIEADRTVSVNATATEDGAITSLAGTITELQSVVVGLESVNNRYPVFAGAAQESDDELRARYRATTMRFAASPIGSIQTALVRAGAIKFRVDENPTNAEITLQGIDLEPHSIHIITDEASGFADAVAAVKTIGAKAVFANSLRRSLRVTARLTIEDGFPADGLEQMKLNLLALGDQLRVGYKPDADRFKAGILAVGNHQVDAFDLTLANGDALEAETELTWLYFLDEANISINLTA